MYNEMLARMEHKHIHYELVMVLLQFQLEMDNQTISLFLATVVKPYSKHVINRFAGKQSVICNSTVMHLSDWFSNLYLIWYQIFDCSLQILVAVKKWSTFPNISGLLHLHWDDPTTASVSMKQPKELGTSITLIL